MIWFSLCNEFLFPEHFLSCYISQDLPVASSSETSLLTSEKFLVLFGGLHCTFLCIYVYEFSPLFFETLEGRIHTLLISITLQQCLAHSEDIIYVKYVK